jgi:hypothetical protein
MGLSVNGGIRHRVLAHVGVHLAIGTEKGGGSTIEPDPLLTVPAHAVAAFYPAAAISFGFLARRRLACADRTSATR